MPKRAVSQRSQADDARNYKGWSANVNLISHQFSLSVASFAHLGDLARGCIGDLSGATLETTPICLTTNDIGRNHNRPVTPKTRVGEPAFWRQENKNQDQQTKHIPLPRCTRICPKDDLPCCVRQKTHNHPVIPDVARASCASSFTGVTPVPHISDYGRFVEKAIAVPPVSSRSLRPSCEIPQGIVSRREPEVTATRCGHRAFG